MATGIITDQIRLCCVNLGFLMSCEKYTAEHVTTRDKHFSITQSLTSTDHSLGTVNQGRFKGGKAGGRPQKNSAPPPVHPMKFMIKHNLPLVRGGSLWQYRSVPPAAIMAIPLPPLPNVNPRTATAVNFRDMSSTLRGTATHVVVTHDVFSIKHACMMLLYTPV